jgi:hypothetical protein
MEVGCGAVFKKIEVKNKDLERYPDSVRTDNALYISPPNQLESRT